MPPHSTTRRSPINALSMIRDLEGAVHRFWAFVDTRGDCWLWTGGTGQGYGRFSVLVGNSVRAIDAHRFSYLLVHGCIKAGQHICHSCDINYPPKDTSYRRCVRPDHLWSGTPGDNVRDAFSKGRMPQARFWLDPANILYGAKKSRPGEVNGKAKMTQAQIDEIRARYAAGGITQIELAREYGMSQPGISHILCRDSWRHI